MNYFIEAKFEEFYKSLNDIERCVFREYFKKRHNQSEVGRICFDPPVGNTRVAQYVSDIKVKFFIIVMEYDEKSFT
jgi:DNA-directed RNA polymerase specialized sigma subunit